MEPLKGKALLVKSVSGKKDLNLHFDANLIKIGYKLRKLKMIKNFKPFSRASPFRIFNEILKISKY